jgi:hypothetical protein
MLYIFMTSVRIWAYYLAMDIETHASFEDMCEFNADEADPSRPYFMNVDHSKLNNVRVTEPPASL